MDPDATYKLWFRALLEEDAETARLTHEALRSWLAGGGFEPIAFANPAARRQFYHFDRASGRLV